MIWLERASRWYGQILGLNDVSCTIPAGLTALLGPNGAGKSTMLKLITGQLRPTAGRVVVLDAPPFANPRVLGRIGYCPELEQNYDDLTGREFVTLMGSMSGVRNVRARAAEMLELVGMTANADRKIGGYSKGMRQRVKLGQALMHDPPVLVLDEPLNGLDPVGRHDVCTLLKHMAAQGKCVLVASHILHEVEQLTHSMLLIHRGRLLAQGDIFQIRGLIDKHPHRVAIDTTEPRRLAARLLDLPYVLSLSFDDARPDRLEIQTRQPEAFYAAFSQIALADGAPIRSFHSPDNNLEAVFRYLVGD